MRASRIWLWFVAGFLVVLVGLMFFPIYFYDGRVAVYRVYVWQYYALEIQRAWNSTGNLGSASGTTGAAVTNALQHLLFAVIGGAITVGLGWLLKSSLGREQCNRRSLAGPASPAQ